MSDTERWTCGTKTPSSNRSESRAPSVSSRRRAIVKSVVQHRVRYHEADAQGFLFNSRYLELADVAMTEYFRSLGFPYTELIAAGADPSVVSAGLNFARPARFDDVLDIGVACTRVGRSSFDLAMAISRNGQTIAGIDLTYVNVDSADAVSRVLPVSVADALRADSAVHDHRGLDIHQ